MSFSRGFVMRSWHSLASAKEAQTLKLAHFSFGVMTYGPTIEGVPSKNDMIGLKIRDKLHRHGDSLLVMERDLVPRAVPLVTQMNASNRATNFSIQAPILR
jgi:hypothetical protein